MATITATSMAGSGKRALTYTSLTGTADTFTYDNGANQSLVLYNDTGGALTPVIDGSGASTVAVVGVGSVDISGGYSVGSVSAGATVIIPLNSIAQYLAGTIAITGATGIEAALLSY